MTVSAGSDYGIAEERLRTVVASVFSEYREEMERQYHHMEKILTTAPPGALQPTSRLHLAPSGIEVIIRYPVDLMRAAEIDDRVMRELLGVLERDPQLKSAITGQHPLRLKTDIGNKARSTRLYSRRGWGS